MNLNRNEGPVSPLMKYCLFSDVHSNYEALKTFLDFTDNLPDLKRVCLGDVAGYGSSPNECIEMLAERHIPVVMGNHDYGLLYPKERDQFNFEARIAIEWQESIIKQGNLKLVSSYPFTLRINKWISVTHSNFSVPADFTYITHPRQALYSFTALKTEIGFFGHTHIPALFSDEPHQSVDNRVKCELIKGNQRKYYMDFGKRYLINPGSLGQPRDNDARSSYVIIDLYENTVTFLRMIYDIQKESRRMKELNLPFGLAERILVGV